MHIIQVFIEINIMFELSTLHLTRDLDANFFYVLRLESRECSIINIFFKKIVSQLVVA
jgi:hypothetical protein